MELERAKRSAFETFLMTVESTASVFVAFVVGLIVVIAGGAAVFAPAKEGVPKTLVFAGPLVVVCEVLFLVWLKNGLERQEKPFIPKFALRQRRWPIVTRPLFAAWWAAHLLVTVPALWVAEQIIGRGPVTPLRMTVAVAVVWMLIHCSLLYLLLATTALYRSASTVRFAWRFRFAIDLVFTGGVLLWARAEGWEL